MVQYRYLTVFKIWLKNNTERFPYPVSIVACEQGLNLTLTGAARELKILVSAHRSILIGVNHKGVFWDILVEFEIFEAKKGKLFYCSACKKIKPYTTKYEFYVEHNFEPFLAWVCENIVAGNWLHIYGNTSSYTVARISKTKPRKDSKIYTYSTPVLVASKV